jgi:hypothetical protein
MLDLLCGKRHARVRKINYYLALGFLCISHNQGIDILEGTMTPRGRIRKLQNILLNLRPLIPI